MAQARYSHDPLCAPGRISHFTRGADTARMLGGPGNSGGRKDGLPKACRHIEVRSPMFLCSSQLT